MNYKNSMVVALLALFLFGCTTSMVSNEKIMGVSSRASGKKIVSIGGIERDGSNSYYDAKAEDGSMYSCSFNGGDIGSAGIIQHEKCTRK
jgi:hypothetical protein